jgi:inositol monophosphatase 3
MRICGYCGKLATCKVKATKMASVNIKLNPLGVCLILLGIGCIIFYAMGGTKWFQSEQKVSMKQLLAVGIDLAKRGGLRVKEIRESNRLNEKTKSLTKEGTKELKTEGDMQSHRAIVYGFAKAFPGLKVVFLIRPNPFQNQQNVKISGL